MHYSWKEKFKIYWHLLVERFSLIYLHKSQKKYFSFKWTRRMCCIKILWHFIKSPHCGHMGLLAFLLAFVSRSSFRRWVFMCFSSSFFKIVSYLMKNGTCIRIIELRLNFQQLTHTSHRIIVFLLNVYDRCVLLIWHSYERPFYILYSFVCFQLVFSALLLAILSLYFARVHYHVATFLNIVSLIIESLFLFVTIVF